MNAAESKTCNQCGGDPNHLHCYAVACINGSDDGEGRVIPAILPEHSAMYFCSPDCKRLYWDGYLIKETPQRPPRTVEEMQARLMAMKEAARKRRQLKEGV